MTLLNLNKSYEKQLIIKDDVYKIFTEVRINGLFLDYLILLLFTFNNLNN